MFGCLLLVFFFFFFFFQAEDGIRDLYVTGVQTCALPIWARTPAIFDAYRKKAHEVGKEPTPDKLAYMALIGVGETREEGRRRADQILGYSRTSGIVAPQFANPPGYVPAPGAAQMLKGGGAMAARATRVQRKDGTPINPRTMSVEDAIDAGLSFAGTPDDVFDQLKAFYDHVGGFGHL